MRDFLIFLYFFSGNEVGKISLGKTDGAIYYPGLKMTFISPPKVGCVSPEPPLIEEVVVMLGDEMAVNELGFDKLWARG